MFGMDYESSHHVSVGMCVGAVWCLFLFRLVYVCGWVWVCVWVGVVFSVCLFHVYVLCFVPV